MATQTPETTSNDDLLASAMGAVAQPLPGAPQQAAPAPPASPSMEAEMPIVTSRTLEGLDPKRRPRPATVCEGCPNSVWFTSPAELKCYCRVMYLVTWSIKEPNQITACDGMFVGQDD